MLFVPKGKSADDFNFGNSVYLLATGQCSHFEPLVVADPQLIDSNVDSQGNFHSFFQFLESTCSDDDDFDYEFLPDVDETDSAAFPITVVNDLSKFPVPQIYFELPAKLSGCSCSFSHRKSDLFYTVDNSDNTFCLCFDSAASDSAISMEALHLIKELGFDVLHLNKTNKSEIRVMDGVIKSLGTVHIILPIHGKRRPHNFIIFDNKDVNSCIILGADFQVAKDVQIHYFSELFEKELLLTRQIQYVYYPYEDRPVRQSYSHEVFSIAEPVVTESSAGCRGGQLAIEDCDSLCLALKQPDLEEEAKKEEDALYKRIFNASEVAEKQRRHTEISQIRRYI